MRSLAVAAALAAACAGACAGARTVPPPPRGLDEAAARAALERFAHALERARWEEALSLLSARWQAAYTPGRLAADFAGAGPAAREAAARVRSALASGVPLRTDAVRALLPVAPGRAAVLVAEAGGWRVDALE